MENFMVKRIGVVQAGEDGFCIQVDKEYLPALSALDGFSHLNILWWFSECDNENARATLVEKSPYKNAPAEMGVFATRSPMRPNPIALSCSQVTYLDLENGIIGLAYMDANHNTPVLDIKPYTPSVDRVEHPKVPQWCAHWPKSYETSGDFNWENEFNF